MLISRGGGKEREKERRSSPKGFKIGKKLEKWNAINSCGVEALSFIRRPRTDRGIRRRRNFSIRKNKERRMADVTHRHLEMNFLFYDFHHIFASHGRVGGYDVLEPE